MTSTAPAPVESKVKASTFVSALVTLAAFVVHFAWPQYADLPDYAQSLIGAAVVAACTFAAGWLAKHTPRDTGQLLADAVAALPDYSTWLKADLVGEARARGLAHSGTKADVVARLVEADRAAVVS